MQLLDGKLIAEKILSNLRPRGSLHIILVGRNPASLKYVELKQQACQKINQKCVVHHLTNDSTLPSLIKKLNADKEVTGFFVQLPIEHKKYLNLISPQKDVDGLLPNSPFTPAVVKGIIRLLDEYHLTYKLVVVVNDSALIGQPLKKIFTKRKINVILCNDQTKNLPNVCKAADLLISATGVKNLITADYVKQDAIVVDVANGDVDFESVKSICSYITPTYGGIGPMTVACLLENLTMVK